MTKISRKPLHSPTLVETLESRRMFAAAGVKDGVLWATGTEGVDVMRVDTNIPDAGTATITVTDNGVVLGSYKLFAVHAISINTYGSDDVITINDLFTDVSVRGGTGNDRIESRSIASHANYNGEAGTDVISFATRTRGVIAGLEATTYNAASVEFPETLTIGGCEELDGTNFNDQLSIGTGYAGVSPTIHGGAMNDQITGSSLNDILYGDDGNDSIHGGFGNDWINGGLGHDWMYGEAGNDTIVANSHPTGALDADYAIDGGDGSDLAIIGTSDFGVATNCEYLFNG